ncbi:hypothetical protein LPJ64_006195 [Coemansia asiatica]|uniref:Uncharacterized protein n=1 Tax=Coemansia asiatica TaxID=1052880 RepID=A0A9W8CGX6_9FUNG|nr:hypothetical protein LPJ64_006195 [Coemansia asiatica]
MSSQKRPALPANRYKSRTAAKQGACFICANFTCSLFVSDQGPVSDWFYVCSDHTTSPSFCSLLQDPPVDVPPPDTGTGTGTGKGVNASTATEDKSKSVPSEQVAKKYTLHRDVFYLRLRPFIQQFEKQQSSRLVQRLPGAPTHLPK